MSEPMFVTTLFDAHGDPGKVTVGLLAAARGSFQVT